MENGHKSAPRPGVTLVAGIWRELDVAVKTIVFRGEYDSKDYHQRAIREVAITSGLAHPNVVCTYSYDIKRLQAGIMEAGVAGLKKKAGVNILDSCVDWKLFIIQEYCEKGTLQDALKARAFVDERTGNPDLVCVTEQNVLGVFHCCACVVFNQAVCWIKTLMCSVHLCCCNSAI